MNPTHRALLDILKACRAEALSQQEIQVVAGASRSTVQRNLALLVEYGLLEKRVSTNKGSLFVYVVAPAWKNT
jgi:DNA-binding IclR family transcriptional regulator